MNQGRRMRAVFECPGRPAGPYGPRGFLGPQGMVTAQLSVERSMLVPFSSAASRIVHL
jgi:hypothetical protein